MKKLFLLIILNVFFVSVCISQTRVTGGYDLNIKQAPWQVMLKYGDIYICGGNILSSNYILTARHCFENINVENLKVVAGITCKNEITENNLFSVSNVILHPTLDVAIIRLAQHIPFDNTKQPISFIESVNDDSFYNEGNVVRVSGWGWLTPNGFNPANCLQAADVNIISNEDANEQLSIFNNVPVVTENEFATVGVGTVRQGACRGDSGGPLTIWSNTLNKHILLGIVSRGTSNCIGDNANSPSIFLRTSRIVEWILQNICSLSGPSVICTEATYTIENLPAGATVQWSTSNNNDIKIDQQGNLFRRSWNSYEPVNISAVIYINGNPITTLNKAVNVGVPDLRMYIVGSSGSLVHISVDKATPGFFNYLDFTFRFSLEDGSYSQIYQNTSLMNVLPAFPAGSRVRLVAYPTAFPFCYRIFYLNTPEAPLRSFSLSPNPATTHFTFQVKESEGDAAILNRNANKTTRTGVYEIQLWSATALLKTYKTDLPEYQISVADLPKGMYFVRIIIDGKIYTEKLIKN